MDSFQVRCYMHPKVQNVLSRPARYKVLYGGRGSGKSYAIANALIVESIRKKLRILCTREFQSSIRDSVHRLLCDRIFALKLGPFFDIMKDTIISKTGSEFIFRGIRSNISEIKSLEGINYVWCEEAEKISRDSWDVLIPTIRKEGSEIWISFNPDDERGETYNRFVIKPPEDSVAVCLTYEDNDLFPEVLRKEMEWDKKNDVDKYNHVWCGYPKKYGTAVIFKHKLIIEDFETPDGVQLFFGADFGYAQDPTALVRMHIRDRKLWIDYEAYGVGVEIEDLHTFFNTVPGSHDWKITADCARPETISFLTRPFIDKGGVEHEGFQIVGAEKGKGSVEDGIEFLRTFEAIVIHPRCTGAIDNFQNYRWKQDKITDEVLPIPLDKSNHIPDACRYAMEGWVKGAATIFDVLED